MVFENQLAFFFLLSSSKCDVEKIKKNREFEKYLWKIAAFLHLIFTKRDMNIDNFCKLLNESNIFLPQ